jgi:hypothetical protein
MVRTPRPPPRPRRRHGKPAKPATKPAP